MGWPSIIPLRRPPPDLVYTPIDVTSLYLSAMEQMLSALRIAPEFATSDVVIHRVASIAWASALSGSQSVRLAAIAAPEVTGVVLEAIEAVPNLAKYPIPDAMASNEPIQATSSPTASAVGTPSATIDLLADLLEEARRNATRAPIRFPSPDSTPPAPIWFTAEQETLGTMTLSQEAMSNPRLSTTEALRQRYGLPPLATPTPTLTTDALLQKYGFVTPTPTLTTDATGRLSLREFSERDLGTPTPTLTTEALLEALRQRFFVSPTPDNGSSRPSVNPCRVSVSGYYRKDGTYVRGHQRTCPNSTTADNLGSR